MSPSVLTNCNLFLAGLDVSGYSNELSLKLSMEDQDVTTFGSGGSKQRIGGLRTVEAGAKGFWDSALDTPGFANLGTVDQPVTISGTGVEGDPAWFFQASNFSWERFGSVGDVDPFDLALMGTNGVGLVAGQLAKAKGSVAAIGQLGSVLNLGAPTATQWVYAVLHVFVPGTTITVQVQSDDNAGMTSPTTRGTLGPVTVAGGTWLARVAGPFTGETYWRLNVSAITGSHTVAGAIGIG